MEVNNVMLDVYGARERVSLGDTCSRSRPTAPLSRLLDIKLKGY